MRYSKDEKAKLLEDWKASGKSICAYVKEKGLVRWTFTKWLKTDRKGKPSFVEVAVPTKLPSVYTSELLIEKGDVRIHIPLLLSGRELRSVIEVLGTIL